MSIRFLVASLVLSSAAGTARAQRQPYIVMEPHHARSVVPLTGILDGPVAVDDRGRITFLAGDGVLGQVARDGTLLWAILTGPPGGEAALGTDGTVYAAGRDGRLYAVGNGGAIAWLRRLGGTPVRGVAVGPRIVAVALENGRLELWRPDGSPIAAVPLGGTPSAAAVLAGGDRVVVPLRSGEIVGVAAGGRKVAWRTRVAASPVGPLAVAPDGAVVAGTDDGTVLKLQPSGGIAWRAKAGGSVTRSPALAEDGAVIVAAGAAVVAFGSDGALRWRRNLRGPIVAGPLLADDGTLFVGCAVGTGGASGEIAVLGSAGDLKHTIALDARPARSMTLAAGSLWVGLTDQTLHRLDVPQQNLAHGGWPKTRGGLANAGAL